MPTYNVTLVSGSTSDDRPVTIEAGSIRATTDWVLFFYGLAADHAHDVAAAFPTERVISVVAVDVNA
jgi:hypothetical protein